MGLPPRGRGNPPRTRGDFTGRRSTPAWAGKPDKCQSPSRHRPVYPRVGGETYEGAVRCSKCRGLPPRGRGNHSASPSTGLSLRSTPAWAGKPPARPRWSPLPRVYPRVGGETIAAQNGYGRDWGLPPRGRGNRESVTRRRQRPRSTPAWAGKPPLRIVQCLVSGVYPRVGGETVAFLLPSPRTWGLPPRGRGNRMDTASAGGFRGSTPAWAGKPPNQDEI